MEEMETVYFEEAHRRTLKKLKGGSLRKSSVSVTCIGCFVMRVSLIDVPKEDTASRKIQVIFLRKTPAQQNQKVGEIVSLLMREVRWKCRVCMVINQKGGTKFIACDTEQLGHEGKSYVSVSVDVNEALASSRIGAGGLKFGGLRM